MFCIPRPLHPFPLPRCSPAVRRSASPVQHHSENRQNRQPPRSPMRKSGKNGKIGKNDRHNMHTTTTPTPGNIGHVPPSASSLVHAAAPSKTRKSAKTAKTVVRDELPPPPSHAPARAIVTKKRKKTEIPRSHAQTAHAAPGHISATAPCPPHRAANALTRRIYLPSSPFFRFHDFRSSPRFPPSLCVVALPRLPLFPARRG